MAQQGKRGGKPTRGTAPSAANIRDLEPMEPSEKAKATKPSDVDAMGQDKRRQVVGHAYGPSRRSQVVFFVAIAALLVIVVGGYALAIAAFDQPPDSNPDKAPWSQPNAAQIPTHDPSGPCGEPGNPYPTPADSPCGPGGIKGQAPVGTDVTESGSSHAAEQ
jgi:hypothetical protein